MITTELRNIAHLVAAKPKLQAGVDFMHLMRTEGILEAAKGFFPAICGGAVRDGLFTGREINDVDIFLFREMHSPVATDNPRTGAVLAQELEAVRQNLLSWLEDEEITSTSLLNTRAASYFGEQRFIDIIEFEWHDTRIQVMIPVVGQISSSLDYLLRTMPIYSGVALTMEHLRLFDATLASYYLPDNNYFVVNPRDASYLQNKFGPNARVIPVNNSREATVYGLSAFVDNSPLSVANTDDTSFMSSNSAANLARKAAAHSLEIPQGMLSAGNLGFHTL